MKSSMSALIFAAVLQVSIAANCDTPLGKPAPVHVCSPRKDFCVDSIPGGDTVFRCTNSNSDRCHWSIPGWHRNIFVSDYATVAVVYDGGNLLPVDYDPDTVMIQLWKNGLMLHEIRARDIKGIRNRRTQSHYEWGNVKGFDENSQIIVSTSAGKTIDIEYPPEPSFNYFPPAMVDKFRAQWYGKFLNAFQEPSLWEISKKSSSQYYRFTWLPTFNHPVVIHISVRPDGICELTLKIGLGAGGYDPGMLIRNETRPLTKQQSDWFLNQVERKFWSYPGAKSQLGGMDGSRWIFEGVRAGRYQIQDLWSPKEGPIYDLGLGMMIGLANLRITLDKIY